MELLQIHGQDLRDALEKASSEVGKDALVVSRRVHADGTVVLEVTPPAKPRKDRKDGKRGADPLVLDVQRCLNHSGASQELSDRICAAVDARRTEGRHPLDLAAEEIALTFPIASMSRTPGRMHVFAVLGQTGVGKTTSLVKLASRLARRRRNLAVATLDTGRVGSLETWKQTTQTLRIPFIAQREAASLLREQGRLEGTDLLLLDTTGNVEADARQIARLTEMLDARPRGWTLSTALVLSAASSPSALEAVSAAASEVRPRMSVLTKLDETRVPGPLLEHVLLRDLPVAFLSDGPEIASSFHRPSGDHFADLLLRGKIR
jgi:flagellar biosynthesis protein FlhF